MWTGEVHYRIFDDGLAILPRDSDATDLDPSIGKVICGRIYPSTVGVFKRAIARHEGINPSRIAALRFSADGGEIADSTILTSLDDHGPGIPEDQPFFITLSRMTDGISEPVLSPTEPEKVSCSEKPVGWRSAHAFAIDCVVRLTGCLIGFI